MIEIYFAGPESRVALRPGELAKLGITTDGAVLSGSMSLGDAFERRSILGPSAQERDEAARACQLIEGTRRR